MQTFELTVSVSPDQALTATVPTPMAPGDYRVVMSVTPVETSKRPSMPLGIWDILEPLPVGPVHENLTYRREDIYDDDGR